MARAEIEAERKRQIVETTMQSIHEDGIANASLKRIGQRSGITSGLILHYFGSKEALFEEVYRTLYRTLADQTLIRLKTADSEMDRLFAVLEAQVCAEMTSAPVNATWHAICAYAPQNPTLSRMERINSKRLHSNLMHSLKKIGLNMDEATEITEELHAMIYGLWSNLVYDSISEPERARQILRRYIAARIPQAAAKKP